jgi:hypothetical protein
MGEDNIDYDDVQRAAQANGRSVAETFDIMQRTENSDRKKHPDEYAGQATIKS